MPIVIHHLTKHDPFFRTPRSRRLEHWFIIVLMGLLTIATASAYSANLGQLYRTIGMVLVDATKFDPGG